ncbi:MAG: 23S rRNA (adenine(2503)-C(2))-methyltransferase RlmN [Acidobacteriota bacterium]|nr:23S rRNA (adenine(2503)-C(2))-methyltransferase RlmN [Acidobacteriota bacterium]
MDTRVDLAELSRVELEAAFTALGLPRFRATQIYRWMHRRAVTDFAAMTNLPADLRERLASEFRIGSPSITRKDVSSDGTTKLLLRLADGREIESVYIPDTPNQTFCVSTQVGCAMSCGFCLTGKMGLMRNLTPGEIAAQVRLLAHETGLSDAPFNIVLMGMGEPLHNYDATMKALRMLYDEEGLAVHPKRVTLSTVGVVPGLERLATEPDMPNIAISLHATTDEARDALVPINRKWKIRELLDMCRQLPIGKRRRITFEYVLLDGVNDTPADARRLVKLLGDLRAKVNLLPLNAAPGIPFARPSDERVNAFARILADAGTIVSVRKSRGRDIRAACGQLIVEGGGHKSAAQKAAAAFRA